MLSPHVFYVAIAAFGISAGAAILVAVAIIAGVALWQHRVAGGGIRRTAESATGGRAAGLSRHEPALR